MSYVEFGLSKLLKVKSKDAFLALLDYVSSVHEIDFVSVVRSSPSVRPSSVRPPSVSQLSL